MTALIRFVVRNQFALVLKVKTQSNLFDQLNFCRKLCELKHFRYLIFSEQIRLLENSKILNTILCFLY